MDFLEILDKKKKGLELKKEEIKFFVDEYTKGNIPDYQASAFLMAVFLNKLTKEETSHLTLAMAYSGEVLDLSDIKGIKVDKHSTGGVGDKVSLIIAPLVAPFDIPVAKMSGKGLGFTGGTIDKLESIEGFNTSMDLLEFKNKIKKHNIVIAGQTGDLAPADKKIYALRDVTTTVDDISLIASSIMSKKIASGADAIVLDIKVGNGAFMKTLEDGEKLGKLMVEIGNNLGKRVICVLSNMNEPLGFSVGNVLEVKETIDVLKGKGSKDLVEVSLTLASIMIYLGGKAKSIEEGKKLAQENLNNGIAYNKFKEWINAQGGDICEFDDLENYKKSKDIYLYKSKKEGYIEEILAEDIGKITMTLGAGREIKDSVIDESVGIVFRKKVGDFINIGDVICEVHHNSYKNLEIIHEKLDISINISKTYKPNNELIYKIIK